MPGIDAEDGLLDMGEVQAKLRDLENAKAELIALAAVSE